MRIEVGHPALPDERCASAEKPDLTCRTRSAMARWSASTPSAMRYGGTNVRCS